MPNKKNPKYNKLDTQLFPECEGTKFDRDVVKKTRKAREKKSFNLKKYITASNPSKLLGKNVSKMNQNHLIAFMKSNGYVMFRSEYPWGHIPSFKMMHYNVQGEDIEIGNTSLQDPFPLFVINGVISDRNSFKEYIKWNWEPSSRQEQDLFNKIVGAKNDTTMIKTSSHLNNTRVSNMSEEEIKELMAQQGYVYDGKEHLWDKYKDAHGEIYNFNGILLNKDNFRKKILRWIPQTAEDWAWYKNFMGL